MKIDRIKRRRTAFTVSGITQVNPNKNYFQFKLGRYRHIRIKQMIFENGKANATILISNVFIFSVRSHSYSYHVPLHFVWVWNLFSSFYNSIAVSAHCSEHAPYRLNKGQEWKYTRKKKIACINKYCTVTTVNEREDKKKMEGRQWQKKDCGKRKYDADELYYYYYYYHHYFNA